MNMKNGGGDAASTEVAEPGLYIVRPDGSSARLGPGAYAVDEDGGVGAATSFQEAINQFPWKDGGKLLEGYAKGSARIKLVNLIGMYVLAALTIGLAAALGFTGHLDGQAVAGFLGAAVGYLLSRTTSG